MQHGVATGRRCCRWRNVEHAADSQQQAVARFQDIGKVGAYGNDARASAAEDALRSALTHGPVVACEVVISEVVAGLGHGSVVIDALEDAGIGFVPLELRAAVRAGEMQRRYRQRLKNGLAAPAARRTVPDFLIGAHALLQCTALITRDAGFFLDYFKGLKVIVPKTA